MHWNDIIGQETIKKTLRDSVKENRISHAQLFVGKEGYGGLPLALAYVKDILMKENPSVKHKIENLNYLDLHFSFPTYTEGGKALSKNFLKQWREMILANPYASDADWIAKLDSEKKQMIISVHEVEEIIEKFKLKSFEGTYKILIISKIEKMNDQAANKFLKFLEEPPEKTIILLLAENIDFVLPTILSRCQLLSIPNIPPDTIQHALVQRFAISLESARTLAFQAQGDWNLALKLLSKDTGNDEFEALFVQWVRNAFLAKTKPAVIRDLILWAREIASWNREKQKRFLDYCAEIFRLALLHNYDAEDLVYNSIRKNGFKWEGFSRFIHGANIESILEELSNANMHLYRNGNAKIIWTDMGIKLTRYIHRSAV
ncbi:DNA polymerase III subunit delta' [Elizabethkingia argentiflava]|uniref:DNA polymerase III subunit delta n=1 Tax=Elizabethkingia argenteiflava TaxID=2681556 RepID=A0A845PXZ0_9FLAO|nr:DNA polymerase III subunit delta' [Elizabethkingia argenteiflava]NAW52123.1 DNA polymerase III subunit delta' [Elizabethkingia argenteiflava]